MAINDKNMADGDFWCNIAAESIYSSAERRGKAAESLKAVIGWAFALFSTSGFAISIFGPISSFSDNALKLFGASFCLFTLAYSIANMAQYPVSQTFRAQNITSIILSFSKTVERQRNIFNVAVAISSLGFLSFSFGLLVQFSHVSEKKFQLSKNEKLKLHTVSYLKDSIFYLPITVNALKNDTVHINIYVYSLNDSNRQKRPRLLFAAPLSTDTSGMAYYSFSHSYKDSIDIIVVEAIKEKREKDTTYEEKAAVRLKLNRS